MRGSYRHSQPTQLARSWHAGVAERRVLPLGRACRGALRAAPWWGIAAVIAGGLLVGWWLPFVGYTLVGFVVIDTIIGLMKRMAPAAQA
jgi:asparagine N-glycosylation enzyme membrane subunit Stt3